MNEIHIPVRVYMVTLTTLGNQSSLQMYSFLLHGTHWGSSRKNTHDVIEDT